MVKLVNYNKTLRVMVVLFFISLMFGWAYITASTFVYMFYKTTE